MTRTSRGWPRDHQMPKAQARPLSSWAWPNNRSSTSNAAVEICTGDAAIGDSNTSASIGSSADRTCIGLARIAWRFPRAILVDDAVAVVIDVVPADLRGPREDQRIRVVAVV